MKLSDKTIDYLAKSAVAMVVIVLTGCLLVLTGCLLGVGECPLR